jgi:hypothetical protein
MDRVARAPSPALLINSQAVRGSVGLSGLLLESLCSGWSSRLQ